MSETRRKRTGADFRAAAEKHGITRWQIHDCSICDYPCGYLFRGDEVFYDSGCDCVTYRSDLHPRSWEDVAEQYNMQSHPAVIEAYDTFWYFTEAPADAIR